MAWTVIGAGNPWRRDDGAGRAVVRCLREDRWAARLPAGTRLVECDGDAPSLLDTWSGADAAVVVDACTGGREPGTVHRFDAAAAPLPADLVTASSHGLGVAQAVELGRRLGRLPPRLVVYAVEVADVSPGEGLSPAVASAVERLAARLVEEVGGVAPTRSTSQP